MITFCAAATLQGRSSQAEGSEEYRLIPVASHRGENARSGAYIAFCPLKEQWRKFNDASLRPIQGNLPVTSCKLHHSFCMKDSLGAGDIPGDIWVFSIERVVVSFKGVP
jgi:hypothetical protein